MAQAELTTDVPEHRQGVRGRHRGRALEGSYGATNAGEYWAEGAQFWFHSNFEYRDGARRIVSPEDLLRYDPRLFELLGRVYSDHRIPVDAYCGREISNTSRTGVQNVLE